MEVKKKALIAMSGGVDSSAAAGIMVEAGYDCMGCTMKLHDELNPEISNEKTCCSIDDVADARAVAFRLGINYQVFNFKDDFKEKVMDRFVYAYEHGYTPNPCIDCNRYLKFERLFQRAKELGYDYVVTGHYAIVEYSQEKQRYIMRKGADETKDQSYVLYSLTQDQLAHVKLPLGTWRKENIRQYAENHGFVNADKKESQDICFVPDGDYVGFLERQRGSKYQPGDFVDMDGNVLGTHKGIVAYTIGQRKGLGISSTEPYYVCHKDVEYNRVVLGRLGDLERTSLHADHFNWLSMAEPEVGQPFKAAAKIRYAHKEKPATITLLEEGRVEVVFDEPVRGIAKGQAVVLYDGDLVLGGGTIID